MMREQSGLAYYDMIDEVKIQQLRQFVLELR